MSARHSPGPWRTTNGNLIRVRPVGSDSPICGVHLRGCDGDPDARRRTAEANARLIAAAPDMLKALRDMLKVHGGEGEWDDEVAYFERARAAIAKATGADA